MSQETKSGMPPEHMAEYMEKKLEQEREQERIRITSIFKDFVGIQLAREFAAFVVEKYRTLSLDQEVLMRNQITQLRKSRQEIRITSAVLQELLTNSYVPALELAKKEAKISFRGGVSQRDPKDEPVSPLPLRSARGPGNNLGNGGNRTPRAYDPDYPDRDM
jgi:hypothetical protein